MIATSAATMKTKPLVAQEDPFDEIQDLEYAVPFDINPIKPFGNKPPTKEAIEYTNLVLSGVRSGPRAIDIVDHFIEFGRIDEDGISQWPKDEAWNPLIVEFFKSTAYRAENDMVPWCAAFVNWCLERNGKRSSKSPASQSFLDEKHFARTSNPSVGDLVVFTCYDTNTKKSVGLGHVAFFAGDRTQTHITVKGGNQTKNGKSMICEKPYPIGPVKSSRTIEGKKTPVEFAFNTFVKVA